MAQNITLLGASYSDVPSVELPKTGGGTAQFDDTTIASNAASASDITSGKLAFVNGELVTGTASGGGATLITKSITANGTYNASSDNADGYSSVTVNVSGGGGGLEYETGTWTPTSNTYAHAISLAKTHSTAPWFYIIWDATDSYSDTTNTIYGACYWNYHQLTGVYNYVSSTSYRYGYVTNAYRGSSATAISSNSININYPYTDQGASNTQYSRYWATETSIKAASNSNSRYFRSGRTYKWIAVWTPTS